MLWIFAGFFGLLGGIFYLVALDARRTLDRLEPVHRAPAAALVGEEAELCGNAQQRTPLKSPLGGRDCVYYKFSVRLDWSRRRGPVVPGNPPQAVEPSRRLDGERCEDFFLETATGRVLIRTQGARFDLSPRATRRVGIEELVKTEHPGLIQLGALVAALAGITAEETTIEQGTELFIAGRRLVDAPFGQAGGPDAERGPTVAAWFIADRPKELVVGDWARTAARAELASKALGVLAAALGLIALIGGAARAALHALGLG